MKNEGYLPWFGIFEGRDEYGKELLMISFLHDFLNACEERSFHLSNWTCLEVGA